MTFEELDMANAERKKIKVDGETYTLVKKEYDYLKECHFFYVEEQDDPFNDLENDIEELESED